MRMVGQGGAQAMHSQLPHPLPGGGEDELALRLAATVNEVRRRCGLAVLAHDGLLASLARAKARDIVALGYWDHRSPTLGSPAEALQREGVWTPCVGENLALAPDPELAHRMLMGSLEHRFNILYPHFTHLGVGVAARGAGRWVFVELFARLPVAGRGSYAYHGFRGSPGGLRVSMPTVQQPV